MNKIAKTISAIFTPLIMPTYAMALALWGTTLSLYTQTIARVMVMLFTFTLTTLVPVIAIYVLKKIGMVKDAGLNERSDRLVPYIISAVCYVAVAIYLIGVHSPAWLWLFMMGGAGVVIVNCVVNLWWKISGHAAAIGGVVAMVWFISIRSLTLYNNDLLFILTVLLAGIIGTSRLLLKRHTVGQVAAGFANGVITVSIFQLLIQ